MRSRNCRSCPLACAQLRKTGRGSKRAPEEPHAEGLQVLRLGHHTAPGTGYHLRGRPERLGQEQRRRRHQLGARRAGREGPARREDGGRHLRRHLRPRAAGPRRGHADGRQLRRRAADRLLRGVDHPAHVPRRRRRVRDQRHCLPAARHPGAAQRLGNRARAARRRRAGAARLRAAVAPGRPSCLHRGGRGRPQAPQAQGEGAAQARRDAGQPHAADGPHGRAASPAQAAGPAGGDRTAGPGGAVRAA